MKLSLVWGGWRRTRPAGCSTLRAKRRWPQDHGTATISSCVFHNVSANQISTSLQFATTLLPSPPPASAILLLAAAGGGRSGIAVGLFTQSGVSEPINQTAKSLTLLGCSATARRVSCWNFLLRDGCGRGTDRSQADHGTEQAGGPQHTSTANR